MDDLANGINPFIVVIQDYTLPDNENAYFAPLSAARDHDNLASGSTTMDLNGAQCHGSKVFCCSLALTK